MKEKNLVRMFGVLPFQGADPIPVGRIPDGGTQRLGSSSVVNGTGILWTVTAATTFYLCQYAVTISNLVVGTPFGFIGVRNGADVLQYKLAAGYCFNQFVIVHDGAFMPPLEIPAGYDVFISSNADNCYVDGFVFGYEE